MLLLCLFNLVAQPHPFGSDGFLKTCGQGGQGLIIEAFSPSRGARCKSILLMAKNKNKTKIKVVLQTHGQ
jgi:hypothetical protein